MPQILERLTQQLGARGVKDPRAAAVEQLQKYGILEKGSDSKLTNKGVVRNAMTPEERAKDRAAKYSGKRPEDYRYNAQTNIATLKKNKY